MKPEDLLSRKTDKWAVPWEKGSYYISHMRKSTWPAPLQSNQCFVFHMKVLWVLGYPKCAQWRFWSLAPCLRVCFLIVAHGQWRPMNIHEGPWTYTSAKSEQALCSVDLLQYPMTPCRQQSLCSDSPNVQADLDHSDTNVNLIISLFLMKWFSSCHLLILTWSRGYKIFSC